MTIETRVKRESLAFGISFGSLFLLLIGAIIFYRERMLFVDPAFITFEIINSGNFVFSEQRYGAFITQLFPLLASKAGLPLKAIMILYSASFYIFYCVVAFISGHVLKQYKLAILFCFYLLIMVTDVYFWPNNEIHQAVGWMILFLSLYNSKTKDDSKRRYWIHALMVISLFFATISHLLIMFPLGFLWLWQIFDTQKNKFSLSRLEVIYSSLIIVCIGLRYWMSHSSWYDGAKLSAVKKMDIDKVVNALGNDQATSILTLLYTKYWMMMLIFSIGVLILVKSKNYLQLGLVLSCAMVYFILVTMTHPNAITANNLFYFESQWMCWSIILCAPFVFKVFGHIKKTQWIVILFSIVFICKVPQLYSSLSKFQDRLHFLTILTENANNQQLEKSYINGEFYQNIKLENSLMMTWGVPVESILLSCIDDHLEMATIKTFDGKQEISNAQDSVYTAFKHLPIAELNSRYFILNTTSKYEELD